ncbi:hypothetical protein SAMN05446935_8596 [Burkholderia sp. YR290]|nr:hypothetical protein SAMN05446935_8596 [Burkholderia sp. YR290]
MSRGCLKWYSDQGVRTDTPSCSSFQRRTGCAAQLKFLRHVYQVGERECVHLSHDLSAVRLHRDFADTQLNAHCLFSRPDTTSAMTSRSRRLSEA